MSSLPPEQIVAAQKAAFETALSLLAKAFDGSQKLVELHLQAAKSTLAENQELLTKAFSAKNPQELLALPVGVAQPAVAKAMSYSRQVSEIVSKAQGEFSATTAALAQQYQRDAQTVVETLAKNAPAATEAIVATWKSAMSSANATNDTARKSAK